MDLSAKQIDEKPKKVGVLKGKPVYHLRTKGGLHLLVTSSGTGYETLGVGPHRAVARHIAQKSEPEVVWSELNKSDHVGIESFALILPSYEELTDRMRALGDSEAAE